MSRVSPGRPMTLFMMSDVSCGAIGVKITICCRLGFLHKGTCQLVNGTPASYPRRLMMRWSPTSRVFSMEPEGITRAWPSVPLINRNMRMTHIQAITSRWMRLRRESVSSVFSVCGFTVFILPLHVHYTLYTPLVHFIGTLELSADSSCHQLRRIGDYDVSGSFTLRHVRYDGARAHVQHKRERGAQNRNNEHGLLKPDGAKRFCNRRRSCERSGAVRKHVAQFAGEERTEGGSAHVHGHEIDGHS